jgi:hypothetical protein
LQFVATGDTTSLPGYERTTKSHVTAGGGRTVYGHMADAYEEVTRFDPFAEYRRDVQTREQAIINTQRSNAGGGGGGGYRAGGGRQGGGGSGGYRGAGGGLNYDYSGGNRYQGGGNGYQGGGNGYQGGGNGYQGTGGRARDSYRSYGGQNWR